LPTGDPFGPIAFRVMSILDHAAAAVRTGRTRLLVDPQGADLEAARVCEADVFDHRYGDGREVMDDWFASHEDVSVFVSLVDDDGCILPGRAGLKVDQSLVEDWGVDPDDLFDAVGLDRATTWEIASISVRPRPDGVGLVWTAALLHGLMQLTGANGATAVVAVLDEGARTLLSRLGVDVEAFPGCRPQQYCGSPASTPVYTVLERMRAHQRASAPEGYRLVTLGAGLQGVDVPDAAGFVLHDRVLDLRAERVGAQRLSR
jgi:hypothetical protein